MMCCGQIVSCFGVTAHPIFTCNVMGLWRNWQTQQTQNLPTNNRMGSNPISPTIALSNEQDLYSCNPPQNCITRVQVFDKAPLVSKTGRAVAKRSRQSQQMKNNAVMRTCHIKSKSRSRTSLIVGSNPTCLNCFTDIFLPQTSHTRKEQYCYDTRSYYSRRLRR